MDEPVSRGAGKRRKSTVAPFTEKAWGGPTLGYAGAAKKLTKEHWADFLELAKTIAVDADFLEADSEGDDVADGDDDLRSNIRM